MPKYLYARGQRLWMRVRDADGNWVGRKTPYVIGQATDAEEHRATTQRQMDEQRRTPSSEVAAQDLTVRSWAERWLADRFERGVPTAIDDRSRLQHALELIGDLRVHLVRRKDARELVDKLNRRARLAPRTIWLVYRTVHNLFDDAVVEELIADNPFPFEDVGLPKRVDADPEWRSQAIYVVEEVERLLSDPLIPLGRRVMYALKGVAGMRHGEAAALCWRHRDERSKPLATLNVVQSWCTRRRVIKRTKTEVTRQIPEHPVLAQLLSAWREEWPRIYGRPPTGDDFVVPTRTFRPISAKDANTAFKRDLQALELRLPAGQRRDRAGHDLRAWYATTCIEDGGEALVIRRTTHAPPRDVHGGYERFSWRKKCEEIAKLKITLPSGEEMLRLHPSLVQAEAKAKSRWLRTQSGAVSTISLGGPEPEPGARIVSGALNEDTGHARDRRVPVLATAAAQLERAARSGDLPRVLEIAAQLRSADL